MPKPHALFFSLVFAFSLCAAAAPAQKPNVILILADDLGWTDLAGFGSDLYETPALDQLARDGMKFTQNYSACTVCSPTRASILTGKWPHRTGVTDYIGAAQPGKWKRNTILRPAPYSDRLSLDSTTIAEALKARGYATFFAGK